MKTKLIFTFYAFIFLACAFIAYNNQLPLLVGLIVFLFISFAIMFLLFIGGQNAYDELSNSFEFINKKYFDLIAKNSEITKSYNEVCKNYSILSSKEIELKKELAKYNRNHDKATGKFVKKDGTFKPKEKADIPISKEQPYTIKGKSIKQLCEENLGIEIGYGYLCGYDKDEDSGKLTNNSNQFIVGSNNNKLKLKVVASWDYIFTRYERYSYVSLPEVITAIKNHRNIK